MRGDRSTSYMDMAELNSTAPDVSWIRMRSVGQSHTSLRISEIPSDETQIRDITDPERPRPSFHHAVRIRGGKKTKEMKKLLKAKMPPIYKPHN